MRTRIRKAFTLVEILIVVVILGILAAIVVPQFTNATQDAQAGNIQAQLDTLNNQIELWKARHNGQLPGGAATLAGYDWASMITAVPGDLNSGGYIKAAPRNPACPSGAGNDPTAVDDVATAGHGWYWDPTNSGSLKACYYDETTGKVRTTP